MSRNLPARPNLEFLKKEAKSLLDVLLQRDARRSSPTRSTRWRATMVSPAGRS